MIELKVSCSTCGRQFPEKLYGDTRQLLSIKALRLCLKKQNWVVQLNGNNIDTYCSEKCAK